MKQPASMCYYCQHFTPHGATCTAFPQGVPHEILNHTFDHRQEHLHDQGVRFEPDPTIAPDDVREFLAFDDDLRARWATAVGASPSH